MNTVHGDIKELRVQHPVLGDYTFLLKSGEGNTYNVGGLINNDDANSIATNGDLIMSKSRVRAFVEAMIVNSTAAGEDSPADFCSELHASPVAADWTFTTMADAVYSGSGWPVTEINPDLQAGTFTMKVVFGRLNKIA